MTYGWRVAVLGAAFSLLVLGANGWLIMTARDWASDDMHVGKGHSGFPPQSREVQR